jgi:hypothetical protein
VKDKLAFIVERGKIKEYIDVYKYFSPFDKCSLGKDGEER